jgi:undecaprenyl pyrophosphate synthase
MKVEKLLLSYFLIISGVDATGRIPTIYAFSADNCSAKSAQIKTMYSIKIKKLSKFVEHQ